VTATRFRVVFSAALEEDLAHAPTAQRAIGQTAAERLTRDGITSRQTRPCRAQERDGTRLPGCVKTYLPWPDGRCGMVFELRVDEHGPFLYCLAFGERHPRRDSRRPSVYQVADQRLHRTP
jgi:hypothetical protein